jgi:predicted  nucleic acid-binding Zn-ribbon protein
MPKQLTTVLAGLFVTILFTAVSSVTAVAQDETEIEVTDPPRSRERVTLTRAVICALPERNEYGVLGGGHNPGTPEYERCVGGGGDAQCNSASKQFYEAQTTFQTSCDAGGMNAVPASGGDIACSNSVACCSPSLSKSGACDREEMPAITGGNTARSRGAIEDVIRQGTARLQDGNLDPAAETALRGEIGQARMQQDFMQCPMRARGGLEDAREQAEQARDKLEQKQEKLVELQEELQLAQIEKEEKLDEVRNEITDERLKTSDELDRLEANLEDEQNQLADEIKRLQDLIQTANEDKAKVHETVEAANNEKLAKEDELYLECLDRAEGIIRRDREACMQAAANVNAQGAKRSNGCSKSMTDIFAGQGQTLVKRMQQGIDREIEVCQNDQRYKSRYALIQRNHFRTIKALNTQMQNINVRIQNINDDINELQTDDMSSLLRNNIKALTRLNERHSAEMDRLQRKASLTAQRVDAKISSIQRKIQLYMGHVEAAQEALTTREAYLATREQFAGGQGSLDEAAFGAAQANYSATKTAARTFVDSCCGDGQGSASTRAQCPKARSFLSKHDVFDDGVRGPANDDEQGLVPDAGIYESSGE